MGALDLLSKIVKGAKQAPFFSKADEVLEELQRGKGTGDEFLTEMVKKGAKPTELKERGIEKALKGKPKMTKAEVKKVFEEKAPPRVQETVYGDKSPDFEEFLEKRAQEQFGVDWWELSRAEKKMLEDEFDKLPATKYEQYKTPGGENYREILLKLPSFDDKRLMELEAQIRREEAAFKDPMQYQWFRDKVAEVQQLKAEQAAAGQPYISSHWQGEPNVLAHIRVQDFKTPEGKKVLLVDEIQSDWHQAGRKKGYRGQESEKISDEEYKRGVALQQRSVRGEPMTQEEVAEMNDILQRHAQSIPGMRVPDAPFKKNWHELAMKRVLDYAAENGYDTVAITPGAEQAKRYDLSKQVDELLYKKNPDGTYQLSAQAGGRGNMLGEDIPAEKLEDYVGKEVAQKIVGGEGSQIEVAGKYDPVSMTSTKDYMQSLSGVDLQVGGEGMKGFYDKILPDYLNTYGKPYGAGVGKTQLKTYGYENGQFMMELPDSFAAKKWAESAPGRELRGGGEQYHSFDITPQMREQIKTKGQPLYSKIGAEAAAGTGAVGLGAQQTIDEQPVQNPVHFTENPDAMLLELMQRN